uniref:Ras association domain family member 11 n=1 Tax=Nothobranchius furzeri TaxID=105023 RepID=A0A8C6VQI9_NOTFU
MEVKVSVNGVPRVVCGVTEDTTCQEVVLALAQALGQPGRYILREKFKDFERCMSPGERPLETLMKYGDQSKEVQLILQHNGSLTWDETGRVRVPRYQPSSVFFFFH